MRKLSVKVVQCDIVDEREKHVATAFQLQNGNWLFRDLEIGWQEEYPGPLDPDHLVDTFKAIRKRRGQDFRAGSAGKEPRTRKP